MRRARNIYHRKDGRFEGRYANGYDTKGKTVYRSVFGKTYTECKEKLEHAKASITNLVPLPFTENKSVTDAVADYLKTLKFQLKPSTIGVYQRYLTCYITPYFENTLCSSLTAEISQSFVNKLIENELSVKTVQSIFSLLHKSIQNIVGNVWEVKLPKYSWHEVDFFTLEEQKRLEQAAKVSSRTDYTAIMLCLYTGIRIGEVCGLQYSDIDFTSGTLQINRTIQRIPNPDGITRTKISFLSPKSPTSRRTIPLPDFLVALLLESKTTADCEFVLSLNQKPLEPRTLQYRFKKICIIAEVKRVNFHTTRHSFAVRALENGFDVKSLSEIMGHSSASVTLSRYAHATDTQKRTCMNALSAVYTEG